MTFAEAGRAMIKGGTARREAWSSARAVAIGSHHRPGIPRYYTKADGKDYVPTHEDITATDWTLDP